MAMTLAVDGPESLNANLCGWSRACGLRYVRASSEEVVAEIDIDERHLQPHGIVHGGVYCGLVETACSVGAMLAVQGQGRTVVGLENSTSFLRSVRAGTLRVQAVPRARGRRSQVWEATVFDSRHREVATGRVRLMCLEESEQLAGERLMPIGNSG